MARTCKTLRPKSGRDLQNDNRLGGEYIGFTLEWDYINKEVHLFMPSYVQKALMRFNHQQPQKPQHQPYLCVSPNYGKRMQCAKPDDTAPLLDWNYTKYIEEVNVSIFCSSSRCTMLTALSAIALE